jgi:hypothetical protein
MTITVQTQNRAGMVANQRRIVVIDDRRLYLPLIQRP